MVIAANINRGLYLRNSFLFKIYLKCQDEEQNFGYKKYAVESR